MKMSLCSPRTYYCGQKRFADNSPRLMEINKLPMGFAPPQGAINLLRILGLDQRWGTVAAQHLTLGSGEVGLDLGAGTADLSIAVIRQAGAGARMIGMDITPEMLEIGQVKVNRLGLQDRIELRVCNAEHIDLPDNSVDGCCSAFTVRNLSDIRQGFCYMLRVVRPRARDAVRLAIPPLARPACRP